MTLPNIKDKTPTAATLIPSLILIVLLFYLQFVHHLLGGRQIVLKRSLNALLHSHLHPQ